MIRIFLLAVGWKDWGKGRTNIALELKRKSIVTRVVGGIQIILSQLYERMKKRG